MSDSKRDFDQDAASWDDKPSRVKLAKDIADTIRSEIKLNSSMDVLDFGCGTGLLTLQLQPFVRSITGIDSSQGMLDVLNTKVKNLNLTNVKTCFLDLEKTGVLEGRYNLIASSMTFHHLKNITYVLKKLCNVLLPKGIVCIADLDTDDGQFHENKQGVFHSGFERKKLSDIFRKEGFQNIKFQTAAKLMKQVHNVGEREFTIFLLTGSKL